MNKKRNRTKRRLKEKMDKLPLAEDILLNCKFALSSINSPLIPPEEV